MIPVLTPMFPQMNPTHTQLVRLIFPLSDSVLGHYGHHETNLCTIEVGGVLKKKEKVGGPINCLHVLPPLLFHSRDALHFSSPTINIDASVFLSRHQWE